MTSASYQAKYSCLNLTLFAKSVLSYLSSQFEQFRASMKFLLFLERFVLKQDTKEHRVNLNWVLCCGIRNGTKSHEEVFFARSVLASAKQKTLLLA